MLGPVIKLKQNKCFILYDFAVHVRKEFAFMRKRLPIGLDGFGKIRMNRKIDEKL